MKTLAEGIITSSKTVLAFDSKSLDEVLFESERGRRLIERRIKSTLRLVELLFDDELLKPVR